MYLCIVLILTYHNPRGRGPSDHSCGWQESVCSSSCPASPVQSQVQLDVSPPPQNKVPQCSTLRLREWLRTPVYFRTLLGAGKHNWSPTACHRLSLTLLRNSNKSRPGTTHPPTWTPCPPTWIQSSCWDRPPHICLVGGRSESCATDGPWYGCTRTCAGGWTRSRVSK